MARLRDFVVLKKVGVREAIFLFICLVFLMAILATIAFSYTSPWIENTWSDITHHPCPQIWQDWQTLYGGSYGYGGYAHYAPTGGLYRATRANELSFYLTGQGGSGRVGYFTSLSSYGTRYWINKNTDGNPYSYGSWANEWNDHTPSWGPEYFYILGSTLNSRLPGGASFWVSGLYDYQGEIIDENWHYSNFYYITFAVDKKAPTISCSSPSYGQTLGQRNFIANGTSQDPTENVIWGGIKKIQWSLCTEGGTQIPSTLQEYQNNWSSMPQTQPWSRAMSLPSGYSDGKYWLVGNSWDGVGNASTTMRHSINFDLTGPNITEHTNPQVLSNDKNPQVFWTVSDPGVGGVHSDVLAGKYRVWKKPGAILVKDWTNGTFSSGGGDSKRYVANIGPLSDGLYCCEFVGLDSLNHWGPSHYGNDFSIDTIPPSIRIASPASGICTNQNPLTVSGTADNGSYVYVRDDLGIWYTYGISSGTWLKSIPLYGGDPYTKNVIQAKASDNTGNAGYSSVVTIYYDVKKPTGSILINSGNTYTASENVSLSLQAEDPNGSGIDAEMISNDPSFSGASWQPPYGSIASWTLNSDDGTKYVYVKYRDRAGNISNVYSDSIIKDTLPPTGSILINGGAQYTNSLTATLNLTASDNLSGVSDLCFSNDGSSYTAWESYVDSKSWTLIEKDGAKTVYVKCKDRAGNIGGPFSDSIVLDTENPSIVITAPKSEIWTNESVSEVEGTAEINSHLYLRDDNNIWHDIGLHKTTTNWDAQVTLAYGDPYKENKIQAKAVDLAGNTGYSAEISVFYDNIAPKPPHISTPSDGTKTNIKMQTISGSGEANTKIIINNNSQEISTTTANSSGVFSTQYNFQDGSYRLRATSVDKAGNISQFSDFDQLIVDTIPPANGQIIINSEFTKTNSRVVTLTLNAEDGLSGVERMVISNSSNFNKSTWEKYTKTRSWTLDEGDGVKSVYTKFKDEAGNISSIYVDSIILDSTPPSVNPDPDKPGQIWKLSHCSRYGGNDRIDTSIELSKLGFTKGSEAVVLSRSDLFPDALTGTILAKKYNGPILLNPPSPSGLDSRVGGEISRLKPQKIFILGTEDALSSEVFSDLENKYQFSKDSIIRIGGETRYETAGLVAEYLFSNQKIATDTAIIATGENFPDALAISSFSAIKQMPIFLSSAEGISHSVADIMKKIGVSQVIIVGANDVVSRGIEDWLNEHGFKVIKRLGGEDRYETAVLISNYALECGLSKNFIFVATGRDFPDALCAGAVAAKDEFKAPILLAVKEGIPEVVRSWIYKNRPEFSFIAGTNDVITDTTMMQLNSSINESSKE